MIRKGLLASSLLRYTEFDASDNERKPLWIIHILSLQFLFIRFSARKHSNQLIKVFKLTNRMVFPILTSE